MKERLPEAATELVLQMMLDLVRGGAERFENDPRLGRLTVPDLSRTLREYPATLREPDSGWADLLEVYRLNDGSGYAVDVPLWTLEEGRSDLTMRVFVARGPSGFAASFEDLLVP